ncbi:MAG: hypothetical protein ACI9U2_000478 [Bradymonadia bacterium]|jgi:hypothetical protein
MMLTCVTLCISLALACCWTSTGSVSYAKHNAFPKVDASKAKSVGEVVGSGSVSGFCDGAAERALDAALGRPEGWAATR